jgi:hypothetical protein
MESSLSVLPDPLSGVENELAIEGVADVTFEWAQRLSLGLALGDLAIEVGPTLRMGLADLADRHHVDGVVEATMTPKRESMEYPTPRGVLDRSDPRIGGEAVPVGEATDVTAIPITEQARIGPTPNSSVSEVFDAGIAG